MIWKILKPHETRDFKHESILPWAESQAFAFALKKGDEFHWLVPPDPNGSPVDTEKGAPVYLLTLEDLSGEPVWELLLRLYPGHPADIAGYSATHAHIPGEVFLNVLGLKNHYKNLADWRELGRVDASCRELARRYDFPINVLRLWNRLDHGQRDEWLKIWAERNVRKNLIREIIRDFYDVEENERPRALKAAREYSAAWKARSGHFPGEKLRDIVREIRYPRFEELAVRMRELKRELNMPTGTRLDIPSGMESNRLTLQVDFTSVEELRTRLKYLNQEKTADLIGTILQNL